MSPIIDVNNLVKQYRNADTNAVDGISFSVNTGELFALLGPNGAGKTTIISILTTTLSLTSGTASIAGYDLDKSASQVRRNVGIIFQKPSLDMNLTAEENVRFHAALYGIYPFRPTFRMMPKAYRDQTNNLAEILGISEDIFKPIKTFSGGMKRKLEIMRSLMHKPKVLFLDEPTVGLDPASRRALWQYIQQVQAESNTTVFLTTHYLDEAEDADTICIINRGKVVNRGTPEKIKTDLLEAYMLIDADNRDQLRQELTELGIPFIETPRFKIPLEDGRTGHRRLKAIDTPLNLLQTHSPTLEEAYLSIVDETQPKEKMF
ncbi:ATP-binding cassette domain-containing protein [Anaerolineales bacterium HSG25]|nr:ATP-binding cassette domain-containing protein [Anaerolineales bacterium HSG25]